MYNQAEVEKKERRKVVIGVAIIAVIILVLIVAIIVTAVNKNSRTAVSDEQNTSFTIAEEATGTEENASGDSGAPAVSGAISSETSKNSNSGSNAKSGKSVSSKKSNVENANTTNSAQNDMPTTGPEDALPVALVLGALAMYLSSTVLVKSKKAARLAETTEESE